MQTFLDVNCNIKRYEQLSIEQYCEIKQRNLSDNEGITYVHTYVLKIEMQPMQCRI